MAGQTVAGGLGLYDARCAVFIELTKEINPISKYLYFEIGSLEITGGSYWLLNSVCISYAPPVALVVGTVGYCLNKLEKSFVARADGVCCTPI